MTRNIGHPRSLKQGKRHKRGGREKENDLFGCRKFINLQSTRSARFCEVFSPIAVWRRQRETATLYRNWRHNRTGRTNFPLSSYSSSLECVEKHLSALDNKRALGQKGVGAGNGNAVLANWYVQTPDLKIRPPMEGHHEAPGTIMISTHYDSSCRNTHRLPFQQWHRE